MGKGTNVPWVSEPANNGKEIHELASWRDFFEFVETVIFAESDQQPSLIWRGQRDDRWILETSLDRQFRSSGAWRQRRSP